MELLVVLVLVVVLVGVFVAISGGGRRATIYPIKDSTHVRGVHQAMVLWAQNNQDRYPLPSVLDAKNDTVAEEGTAKDTTANIISILIYNGFFGPELCVSPGESNGNIQVYANYNYSSPSAAAGPDKSKALWDPAFNVDFTGANKGGFSYGHMPPTEQRLQDWSNTFDATTAVVGNRGPQIASVSKGKQPTTGATTVIKNSNTFLIHGGRNTWEGNIAYNDNHVVFETSMAPDTTLYSDASGVRWNDCLFFNETDDIKGRNNFLGLYIKAGDTLADFKSIWD